MNLRYNLAPGCTPQDIDDAAGNDQCEACDGTGKVSVIVDGSCCGVDEVEFRVCRHCDGTGNAPTRAELRAQREEEKADLDHDLRKDEAKEKL